MDYLRICMIGLLLCGYTADTDLAERQYIDAYRALAITEMHLHGIPASITLAQALVESQAGRSMLARRANNHFGIKCKTWWTGGKYYYADDDRDDQGRLMPSCFRIYDSPEESFADHSRFLVSSARYSWMLHGELGYRDWALGLQRGGYATNPRYAEELIRVIEHFRLFELDVPAVRRQ